jgi:tetratricopeptide (TPR) repeat protein
MFDVGRLHIPIRGAVILPLLLIGFIGASPLSAQQRAVTGGNQSPALIAGRDAIVTYGLTPEQVQELTKAAAAGAVGPLANQIVDLSKRLGVTENAALTLLHILDQEDVPLERLPQKLGEVAAQYKRIQAQLAALNPQNPTARRLAEQAEAEIKAGRFETAHELLRQVTQAAVAAAEQARELRQKAEVAENEQLIQAAASSSAEGDLSMTELHYLEAADLFKAAANLVPPGNAYDDKRIDYLKKEAGALYQQGDEFGDSSVLRSAIERYNRLLELQPRERVPLEWATTQNDLGSALWTLGVRENGSARLEQAVAAFREALKERTRDRAPLQWAATQNNLGNALAAIGVRETGNERLEQAVAAYRDALQVDTRERMPLDWAMTQTNLGISLWTLGVRENSTPRLEEAVAAYRDALKESTRERVPLQWAATEIGLGNALVTLGERESSNARLEEAVTAFRDALKELTRERRPLQWAITQISLANVLATLGEREGSATRLEEAIVSNRDALNELTRDRAPALWAAAQLSLGNRLSTLGERGSGTAPLEEAAVAYRAALEEQTRDRVPLQWAATQVSLGNALWMLGVRESGTARLKEAVIAYRAALEEQTRDRMPLQWAAIQVTLGNALSMLGAREGGTARLEEAVVAYRAALEEQTRDQVSGQWAATQVSLGIALATLGERGSGAEQMKQSEEAITAYRAALAAPAHERIPIQQELVLKSIAQLQENLGFAHFHRGDFAAAALNFRNAGDGTAYRILWQHLASARIGGRDIKMNLQEKSAGLNPAEWPFPVIELFLGRRAPMELMAAATNPDQLCEAQFYLGEWHLLRHERAPSIESLRKALKICPSDFNEYAGAVAELKRLGQ